MEKQTLTGSKRHRKNIPDKENIQRPVPVHGADPQAQAGVPFGGEVKPVPIRPSPPLWVGRWDGSGVALSYAIHFRNDLPISPLSLPCQTVTIKFLISKRDLDELIKMRDGREVQLAGGELELFFFLLIRK